MRVIQFALFGGVNSLQYSAMNSLTLKDLQGSGTGSGNSLFSMVQMLAMSFGVAIAGALLTSLGQFFAPRGEGVLQAFHVTFICMGLVTCFSTWIFAQLSDEYKRVVSTVGAGIPE